MIAAARPVRLTDDTLVVGLDIESTGSDWGQHLPCQLGLAAGDTEFVSDIGWPDILVDQYTDEALAINRFTLDRIRKGPAYQQVMGTFRLVTQRIVQDNKVKRLVPCGWNVAGFDMTFLHACFDSAYFKHFSYRSVDLNAICMALEDSAYQDWKDIKKEVKVEAERLLEKDYGPAQWHDALYDARAAIVCFHLLRARIRNVGV